MRGHRVSLSGSYNGQSTEKLLDDLPRRGILQLNLIGREVTLYVKSENLAEVKKSLLKHGVGNISILEWRKGGMTLAGSGSGSDDEELVKVSLIPAALDEGLRMIALLNRTTLEKDTVKLMQKTVAEVLVNAGITDTLYTIQLNKKAPVDQWVESVKAATLNALFESGGVINIE